MVNEAYLNRLNAELPGRSADGEMGQVDRLDPFRLRVDHQCADRERDAVGNSAFLGVQLEQPGLARERMGQRPLPELEQQQRQGTAEHRGIDQRSEEHTSELQSLRHLVCRLLLEKKKKNATSDLTRRG